MCQSLFFNKETLAQVFSCEFCEISKNTFFHRTPLVAASVLFSPAMKFGSLVYKAFYKSTSDILACRDVEC